MIILSKSRKSWLIVLTVLLFTVSCNGWTIPARTVSKLSKSSRSNALLPRSFPERESHPQQRQISSLLHGGSNRLDAQRSQSSRKSRRRRRLWFLALLTGSTLVAALMSPKSAAAAAATTIAQQGLPTTTTTVYRIQSLQSPVSTLVELQLTLRLLFSALLGAAVGKERSSTHKHSAGVRTMALVSLGACAFTVCSSFGFSMFGRYDPSRMASNVASGVGFVGAGVITTTSNSMDSRHSIVHGLTTATAIWISAAIGVACGVGMFYISTVATASTITILRFGRKKKANRNNLEQQGWELSPIDNRKGSASGEHFHPQPDIPTRSMSLTTTVSLDKLNESDDWDSHYEKHDESDDEEEEEEEEEFVHEEEENQKIVSRRKRFDMQNDKELAEYHESAQASILEHAHAASWGNVTELVSNYKKMGNGEEEEEELLVEAASKRQDTTGRWNETMAP